MHLHSGYVLHVVYRNFEGDHSVDDLLSHPDRTKAVTLAIDDGHFVGPGLSWPELEASADQGAASGVTDPSARLSALPRGAAEQPGRPAGRGPGRPCAAPGPAAPGARGVSKSR
ncbi:hypothetical protein ABZ567_30110 [Streptomyces sp. NPDC016459]|uniref:hypothetical protein n=1 Tax=Streptomyces sp. NPDC016459 TaxID=3157190 RepID=UPI0033D84E28